MDIKITQNLLCEVLDYNEDTGDLRWKIRGEHLFDDGIRLNSRQKAKSWNARFAGKKAGYLGKEGYFNCTLMDKIYRSHRLIWLMKTGSWPDQVDHINGVRLDNRWENLRDASHQENMQNMSRPINNTSGVCGVSWDKNKNKWQANIRENGKQKFIGRFDKFEDAVKARKVAEQSLGYHKNHGRESYMHASGGSV